MKRIYELVWEEREAMFPHKQSIFSEDRSSLEFYRKEVVQHNKKLIHGTEMIIERYLFSKSEIHEKVITTYTHKRDEITQKIEQLQQENSR